MMPVSIFGIPLTLFAYWWIDKSGKRNEGEVYAENELDAGEKIVNKHGNHMRTGIIAAMWGFLDLWLFGFFTIGV